MDKLAELAEPEEWDYQNTAAPHHRPILYNYIKYTYKRLSEEEKIEISQDAEWTCFNAGLVTPNQEPIYALFDRNRIPERQPWHFDSWCRRGQREMVCFGQLPEMAEYFDDPGSLVYDTRRELRANIEHIIEENKDRFPSEFATIESYTLQTLLKGAIDNAQVRVRRNYKTAIPQHYRGKVQLLLPLCISMASKADLALVVENHGSFYRASTCLTLDMAYNNARQLARPDKDWLQPQQAWRAFA